VVPGEGTVGESASRLQPMSSKAASTAAETFMSSPRDRNIESRTTELSTALAGDLGR
jgi:hypothetical protein